MKTIQLTQGQVALVDDEDFEYLSQWKWFAVKNGRTFYAGRQIKVSIGKQRTVWMHRVLLGLSFDSKMEGEHIDHNGCNNQKDNLRAATRSQNNANKSPRENKTSKYLGVCWNNRAKKWVAKIRKDGKVTSLGYHHNEIDAALAYNNAAIKLHGEYANPNKIME